MESFITLYIMKMKTKIKTFIILFITVWVSVSPSSFIFVWNYLMTFNWYLLPRLLFWLFIWLLIDYLSNYSTVKNIDYLQCLLSHINNTMTFKKSDILSLGFTSKEYETLRDYFLNIWILERWDKNCLIFNSSIIDIDMLLLNTKILKLNN